MMEANVANTQSALEKWRERITDVPESQPGAPITLLTGDALKIGGVRESFTAREAQAVADEQAANGVAISSDCN